MNFEAPQNLQESDHKSETSFEEQLRQSVGLVFENEGQIETYMRERYPGLFTGEQKEKLDITIKRELEGFVEALEIEPRVGTKEEYSHGLKEKFSSLSSHDERVAFLRGFTDFRRNQCAKWEVRGKMEAAEGGKKNVQFSTLDDLVVRGSLYRDIIDGHVMDSSVAVGLDFGKWYETVSGRKVIVGLKDDYERMINEGKGYLDNPLDKGRLVPKLREVGFVVEEGGGKKRFELKERQEG